MKKTGIVSLAAILALSLVGCGGNAAGSGSTTAASTEQSFGVQPVSVAETTAQPGQDAKLGFSWWGNQTRNERTQSALDLYSQLYPGVTFDCQFSDWGDYWNKLATASAGHNLSDLVQMDYKYLRQYVDNKILVDLTPYIESGALDVSKVDPGILESGSIDGGVYAICAGVNAPALLYNKTLLDENGITVKDNMTMDEFYVICKEVYEKTGMKTNISYGLGENYIDYTLRSQGVELYSVDGNTLGAASADDLKSYFEIYENGLSEGWMIQPEVFAERSVGTVERVAESKPDRRRDPDAV